MRHFYGAYALLILLNLILAANAKSTESHASHPETCGVRLQDQDEYLSLVIRISPQAGAAEIVKLDVVREKLIQRKPAASDYVYEIRQGEERIAAGFVPEDAFVSRGFGTRDKPENLQAAKSATVAFTVPWTKKANDCSITVLFFQIKPGAVIEDVNLEVISNLKLQQRLALQFQTSSEKLCAALHNQPPKCQP